MSDGNDQNLPRVPSRIPATGKTDAPHKDAPHKDAPHNDAPGPDESWETSPGQRAAGRAGPGGLEDPALYDGVMPRRVFAYLIDATLLFFGSWFIVLILGLLSLGIAFFFVAFIFIGLAITYHSGFIAKNAATPGMALVGLKVTTLDGGKPDLSQALITTIVFYVSVVVTVWIVLLVPLLNDKRRTLHDFLAGTVVVRDLRSTVNPN